MNGQPMTKCEKHCGKMWQNEKLLIMSNFFFYHYVFKKPSAAEASESVYMRERVNDNDPIIADDNDTTKVLSDSSSYIVK